VVHTVVVDEPPTALFSFEPATPVEGTSVKFDGTESKDTDGEIASYAWDFGDGHEATGETPEHSYANPGVYTVTLTVTDTDTHTGSITHTVTVLGKPSALTGAASGVGASSATLNATVNPHGSSVTECTFQFGTTTAYGSSAPCATLPGAGNSAVAVSAGLSALQASTVYHFRILAKNASGSAEGADQTFTTASAPVVTAPPILTTPPLTTVPITSPSPNSGFTFAPIVNAKTGVITTTAAFADPGTLRWLLTFANGKFGVFTARASKCKKGLVRLGGKCRPAKVVFARGSKLVSAPGRVTFTIKPTAAGLKALKAALKHKQGVPVTLTLTFQSARGGSPVVHTRTILVKLKKH
jgi:PKD repeat protein